MKNIEYNINCVLLLYTFSKNKTKLGLLLGSLMREKTDLLNLCFISLLPVYKSLRNGVNTVGAEIEISDMRGENVA